MNTNNSTPSLRDHLRAERLDLADFIEALTPDQWSQHSLCDRWTIRDVAAHLVANIHLTGARMVLGTVKAGFRPNMFIADHARNYRPDLSPAEAARELRLDTERDRGDNPRDFFADSIIHHQDMRRPLGQPRQIPTDRLVAALETLISLGYPFSGRSRSKGLALQATDIAWTTGEGPEVKGPGESLLMALAGRQTTDDLSGNGLTTLTNRQA